MSLIFRQIRDGMLAFWSLLIWLVYYLVSSAKRDPGAPEMGRAAKGILDDRLARGEINVEEYRRLRDTMASEQPSHIGVGSGR
jgi:uncharacterized membrane protein